VQHAADMSLLTYVLCILSHTWPLAIQVYMAIYSLNYMIKQRWIIFKWIYCLYLSYIFVMLLFSGTLSGHYVCCATVTIIHSVAVKVRTFILLRQFRGTKLSCQIFIANSRGFLNTLLSSCVRLWFYVQ